MKSVSLSFSIRVAHLLAQPFQSEKIFSPIGILLIVPLNRSTFNEVFNIVLLKIRNQNKRSKRDIFTFHPSLLCERANLLSVYIVEVEVSESS